MKKMLMILGAFFYCAAVILPQAGTLMVRQVTNDPTVDGVVDQLWDDATAISIPLGETYDNSDPASITDCAGCHAYDSYVTVNLKAAHNSQTNRIFMLATWPDSTASFTRGGSWDFSGGSWAKPTPEQSEDRISFFFPIGTIVGNPFNTDGCMAKCHTYWPTDTDPHVSTHGIVDDAWLVSGRGDMWHSKGARGAAYLSASGSNLVIDPVSHQVTGGTFSMTGYADDKYVDVWLPDSLNGEDGGRYGDAGTSGYSHNRIGDKSRPKFMETNPTDYADAMFLTQEEIDGAEVVGDATTGVSDVDAATYWPNYAGFDAVVPERILRMPLGSRGDISFGAVWSDNMWTAEIGRDLDTGNDDDIQFDILNTYTFEVAGFDNSRHGYEHRTSQKYNMEFIGLIPVELVSFKASLTGNNVSLNWITATEVNNSGFNILRSTNETAWEKIGFVAGFGTTTETHSYSFADENLPSGQYAYRLKQIDFDGTYDLSDVVNVEVIRPVKYNLLQNYPNPFNPSTMISYQIPNDGFVLLKVFDALGNEVATLVNEKKEAGTYNIQYNASGIPSGIYFYSITTQGFHQTRKMIVLK